MLGSLLVLTMYGVLNRMRGAAILSKPVCYALFAVLACVMAWLNGVQPERWYWGALFLLAFAGNYFGFMWCWGKYFPDTSPTYDKKCVPLVDAITTRIYMPYTASTVDPQVLNWKTIAMSLRFIIFFAPKYAVLSLLSVKVGAEVNETALSFAVALALLLTVGVIYRISFAICASKPKWNQYNVALVEVIVGALVIGVADGLVLKGQYAAG